MDILSKAHEMCGDSRLIFLTEFGSVLYGTDSEISDADYVGVFIPSLSDMFTDKVEHTIRFSTGNEVSKNGNEDIDIQLFSIQHFIDTAMSGKIIAFDVLYAISNVKCVMLMTTEWNQLVARRARFINNDLTSFMSYIKEQAHKYGIKGSKLAAMDNLLKVCEKHIQDEHYNPRATVESMLSDLPVTPYSGLIYENSQFAFYEFLKKRFQANSRIKDLHLAISNMRRKYGVRAEAAKNNDGIDWKAVSHAIRAGYQICDLFNYGEIRFPLKEAEYIGKVKSGTLDFITEVQPELERIHKVVEETAVKPKFNHVPDAIFWEKWVANFIRRYYGIEKSKTENIL